MSKKNIQLLRRKIRLDESIVVGTGCMSLLKGSHFPLNSCCNFVDDTEDKWHGKKQC